MQRYGKSMVVSLWIGRDTQKKREREEKEVGLKEGRGPASSEREKGEDNEPCLEIRSMYWMAMVESETIESREGGVGGLAQELEGREDAVEVSSTRFEA